jgi:poly(ADP-ribose) glycohydrolase ARH3
LLLALAEYLADLDDDADVDDDELARRFAAAWHADPHRGYGANPPKIFATVLSGGDWRAAAARSFGGAGSLGNGGAMRAAPVGALPASAPEVAEVARRTATVTHAHPEGQDGAAAIALAAWACLRTDPDQLDPGALLSAVTAELAAPALVAATEAVADTLAVDGPAAVGRMTGTGISAVEAAPAALAAFLHHPRDPLAALTFAVAMGGDTDTIATMSGCLSGALNGEPALPQSPLARLEKADEIRRIADALAIRTYRPG